MDDSSWVVGNDLGMVSTKQWQRISLLSVLFQLLWAVGTEQYHSLVSTTILNLMYIDCFTIDKLVGFIGM